MTQKNLLQSAGDGTAVPAGYIGEVISAVPPGSVTPGVSSQDLNKTITSLTLTPGVWAVSGVAVLFPGTSTGLKFFYAGISLSANAADVTNKNNVSSMDIASTSTSTRYLVTPIRIINVTSSQVVYLVGGIEYTTLNNAVYQNNSTIQAVRIA